MRAPTRIHSSTIIVLVVGPTLLSPALVSAQDGYPANFDARLRYAPPAPTLEELQREYDSIHIWAPAVGIPVSYFAAGGGAALLMAGSIDLNLCFTETPCEVIEHPRTPGERAMIGVGSVLVASGVAGLIASVVQLSKKNRRRRALRHQIAALRF